MKRHTILAVLGLFLLAFGGRAEEPSSKPVTVPFELLKSKHIAVQVKINGKGPYRVIFDTGAPTILLSNKLADEAKLVDKNTPPPLFFGARGEVKIKTVELGDAKVEKLSAVVMDHPYLLAMSKVFGPVEGIVGFPFFARYKMTIDYEASKLTLVPNPGFTPPDTSMEGMQKAIMAAVMSSSNQEPKVISPAGQWGLVVQKKDSDGDAGVTIKEVMADSPASAAGLKAGDRMLTLDDRWTDTVLDAYFAASLAKPGTAVKVTLKRDGKEMEVTVKPAAGF
jgi:hypothetical protein